MGGCYICDECAHRLNVRFEPGAMTCVASCEACGYGAGKWGWQNYRSVTWTFAYAPRFDAGERERLRHGLIAGCLTP